MTKEAIKSVFDANPDVDTIYVVEGQPFSLEAHAINYCRFLNVEAKTEKFKVETHVKGEKADTKAEAKAKAEADAKAKAEAEAKA